MGEKLVSQGGGSAPGEPSASEARLDSPAAALLLACARGGDLDASAEGKLESLLAAGPDWPRLLDLAGRHGLPPLLHRHLAAWKGGVLPREVYVDLWATHEKRARRNQDMADALLEILGALDSAGIPALPYKGPAMALALYGDLALREFGDLDVLIRRRDLLRARDLLKARGFEPEYDLAPSAERAFLRASAQYHLVLRHGSRDLLVELHWKTDPDAAVEEDTEAWWLARPRIPFGGAQVRAFTTSELLLVLALHGSKHRWSRLGWLVDVAELLRREPGLDWQWILGRAAALRATRRLLLGLHLAHGLLRAPLPEPLAAQAASDRTLLALARGIEGDLFVVPACEPGPWVRLRRDLALFETAPSKLRFLLAALFAPSLAEWVRWPLPRGLAFLYPLLRGGRLFAKHVLRLDVAG